MNLDDPKFNGARWMRYAQELLDTRCHLGCEAGHSTGHEWTRRDVDIDGFAGSMATFDAEQYLNTEGYCPGDDDVSRTIDLYGIWEPIETAYFMAALELSPGIVIDFGSQIGWYSMLATENGHSVLAVEACWEHEKLTSINADLRKGLLFQARRWIDENTPILDDEGCPPISVVKIDIEGAEQHALRCIKYLLDADLVANLLVEISPVFNDSYPAIVLDLLNRGYSAMALNPVQEMTLSNYIHILEEIPQVDVMFTRG